MSAAKTASPWDTSMKWGQMGFLQKMSFVVKFVVLLASFGFVFPNLMD